MKCEFQKRGSSFHQPLVMSGLHLSCKPEIASCLFIECSLSSTVHTNDNGEQISQCKGGNGRGIAGVSRLRANESWRQAGSRMTED